MRKFTTRVELHDSDDYEELHKAMKTEGFSRTITIDEITYHLPTAEYNCFGDALTKRQVLASAKRAAATVTNAYAVLVTQADGPREQFGLKTVRFEKSASGGKSWSKIDHFIQQAF